MSAARSKIGICSAQKHCNRKRGHYRPEVATNFQVSIAVFTFMRTANPRRQTMHSIYCPCNSDKAKLQHPEVGLGHLGLGPCCPPLKWCQEVSSFKFQTHNGSSMSSLNRLWGSGPGHGSSWKPNFALSRWLAQAS